jgi:bifunctional non-homologous end joining protein LigD
MTRSTSARPRIRRPIEPVKLTHPDRVVYPGAGITKREVFAYYTELAAYLVPALEDRPLALKQWPKGLSQYSFFRQDMRKALPPWARYVDVPTPRRAVRHVIVDRPETLQLLANYSALELHMWHSRIPRLSEPDWVVFDLDPGNRFDSAITVARALRARLEALGLEGLPKTSGKRGLHVLVPLERGASYEEARAFSVGLAQELARSMPDIATSDRRLSARRGRLYIDPHQNAEGKTIIAPYSLRGVEGAPVSTPLRWSEVTGKLDPLRFNLKTMRKRIGQVGDLFAPALRIRQHLPKRW